MSVGESKCGLGFVQITQWPDGAIECDGECGFVPAGAGLQCMEGSRCKRYLHPGDKGHAQIARYYQEAAAEDKAGECTADGVTP